jgi:ankyrin repeat protein
MSAELYQRCERGDVATVQVCLARGKNINAKHYGQTPMMAAVRRNNIEIVRILLARDDLDITATYGNGNTALHWACYKGNAECVALLGQDRRMTINIINIKNNKGETALMKAVERNHLSCVEMMAELDGVDWETKNKDGESLEDVARWAFAILLSNAFHANFGNI